MRSSTKQTLGGQKVARLCEENLGLVHRMLRLTRPWLTPGRLGYDEALSQGLYALAKAARNFDPGRGVKFSSYACAAISRNLVRRWGSQQVPTCHLNEELSRTARTQSPDLSSDDLETVEKLLDVLNDQQRAVVVLRFYDGLKLVEVGERLGVTKQRAKRVETKALELLNAEARRRGVEG